MLASWDTDNICQPIWAWCARDRQVHRRHWTHVHISIDLKTCTECSQIELSDLDTWLAGSCSIALQRCVGGCIRFMVAQKNHISPRNGPSRVLPKWGPSYLHFWLNHFWRCRGGSESSPAGRSKRTRNYGGGVWPAGRLPMYGCSSWSRAYHNQKPLIN